MDDPVLIARAQAGDLQALQDLLRLHQPRLRRLAVRLCPTGEALDATQETLVTIARKIGSLRAGEAFITWTSLILKRLCIRAFSQVRRASLAAWHLGVEQETAGENPWLELQLQALHAALADLPAEFRQVLWLRDAEGLSTAEVCLHLGLGEAQAKSRLHRARRLFREKITGLLKKAGL